MSPPKIVLLLVILLSFAPQPRRAIAADLILFQDPAPSLNLALPASNPQRVLRQRWVQPALGPLQRNTCQHLVFNLFDDTVLAATQQRIEAGPRGGFAWYGRVDGVAGSQVTLVVAGTRLSATLILDEHIFKIRPWEQELYLVREIDAAGGVAGAEPAPDRAYQPLAVPLDDEYQVLERVNAERADSALPELSWNSPLFEAARAHSEDMAGSNYFDHVSQDGRTPAERITSAGYAWTAYAENIAAGYSTVQAVMEAWMASDGHRANILSSTVCDIGVGYAYRNGSTYGHYWTQDFGRRQGISACPASQPEPTPAPSASGGSNSDSGCFLGQIVGP